MDKDSNIINLRPPSKPLRSVTMGELFSDPPRPAGERRRALVEVLARIDLFDAELKSLRHLVLGAIGDDPEAVG